MQEKYKDLLIEENGRVFVDVAYRGCGSGCKYCYVPSSAEKQLVASYEDLGHVVAYLNRCYQNAECIISFCPNTEPFKTQDSIDRVLFVLRGLQGGRFHVQISTKEYISDPLLHELNTMAGQNAIFLNISMPFLEMKEMEPGAADIKQRISNIERIRSYPYLRCGLYIKPCSPKAVDDIEKYIAVINHAQPNYVCIGVAFNKNSDTPCATLHREDDAAAVISAQKDSIMEFAQKMKAVVRCPVVYSSICAIFQENYGNCSLDLWRYDGNLCSSCSVFHGVKCFGMDNMGDIKC